MEMQAFMDALMRAAEENGISPAEIYCAEEDSFSARAMDGAIESYEVSSTRGLSLRGSVEGKMGFASTEAFDEEAIGFLIRAVKESAALNEAEEQDEIFAGDESYPKLEEVPDDLDQVSAGEKLQLALRADAAARASDPRITQTEGASVSTHQVRVMLQNSWGLKLENTRKMYVAYSLPIAKEGDSTATG